MMKLYELTEAYNNLLDMDLENIDEHLEVLDGEIENKAENIAKVLRSLDGEVEIYKAEEKRLADKRKAIENRSKRLKEYLQEQMVAVDKKKFKTELFSFNIQKNRASVVITNEDKLPEDYFKISRTPIKADIEKALKEGLLTDAAELKQTESLRIR